MPYTRPPQDIAAALVTDAAGIDSNTASTLIHVPASTIRRWRMNPELANDSEVASYVNGKLREIAILAVENAEDAGVAAHELILARKAKDSKDMTVTSAVWIDKAQLLTTALDSRKVVDNTATNTPHPALLPDKPTSNE